MGFEIDSNDQILNRETIVNTHRDALSSSTNQVSPELSEEAFDIASFFSDNLFSSEPTESPPTLILGNASSSITPSSILNNNLAHSLALVTLEESTEMALETKSLHEGQISQNKGVLTEEISGNVISIAESDRKTAESDHEISVSKRSTAEALTNPGNPVSDLITNTLAVGSDFQSEIFESFIEEHFGRIYVTENDLPLAQHPELIGELTENLDNCLPSQVDDTLRKIVNKYLSSLELYRFDANGNKVALSSEEKEKIASEIVKHFHLFVIQKSVDNKQEPSEKAARIDTNKLDLARTPTTELNGYIYVEDIRGRTGEIHVLAFFVVDEARVLSATKEQKIKEQQIDLIEKIKEMVIKREILKKEESNNEISHFEIGKRAIWIQVKIQSKTEDAGKRVYP